MPEDADPRRQLRELREKMDELQDTLARATAPYGEIREYLERFQQIAGNYFRLMEVYQRHGAISPELVVPGLRDPIARDIVRLLFEQGDRNVSQIAEALKARRGTASRRIVREKLAELERERVVESDRSGRWTTYRITGQVARRWASVLGLSRPSVEGLATTDRSP